ncbi:MAG: DUF47 domain-containing protein [Candidatus Methanomethylicaceae archaeon]
MFGTGHVAIWLARQTEKEIIGSCEKHLTTIFTIVDKFKVFMEKYSQNNVEESRYLANEISDLEREADRIKEGIIENLMKSALHPMDQDEIIKLVTTSDDIAAHIKSATRKLLYTSPSDVPEHIKSGLISIVNALVEEKNALKEAIDALTSKNGNVRAMAERTERLEESIDDMRVDLLAQVLKWGDSSKHVSNWLMLKEAIENIETSSDRMEDTADVLRAMAILRGKQ